MTYNNLINHLKIWCRKNRAPYKKYFKKTYINSQIADRIEFKLSTLIDIPFANTDSLKREISYFINVHCSTSALKPQNRFEKNIVNKTIQEFSEYMDNILSGYEDLDVADIPYERMVVGAEAVILRDRFYSVWKYGDTAYWYPLENVQIESVEKFYIMYNYFKPYIKQFEQIIGLPQTHLYCYGENFYQTQNLAETNDLDEYYGSEVFYTDKDFSWAIYFSHEGTVTFAGSIVAKAKELLAEEKEHWNNFELQ